MPHRRDPNHEPISIAQMLAQGPTAIHAQCEGCRRMVTLTVDQLYAMGFTPESIVIDIGWKLRCSACGHKGALTEPDWTTAPRAPGRRASSAIRAGEGPRLSDSGGSAGASLQVRVA